MFSRSYSFKDWIFEKHGVISEQEVVNAWAFSSNSDSCHRAIDLKFLTHYVEDFTTQDEDVGRDGLILPDTTVWFDIT